MTNQPEALILAEKLEEAAGDYSQFDRYLGHESAAMLREQHAEIERLRADAEQWKDLATDAVSGLAYIREVHGDLYGVGWDRVFTKKTAIDKAMAEERKP